MFLTVLNCLSQDKGVNVKDTAAYDKAFIDYWGYLDNWGVEIVQDSIIVNGDASEAIIIPTDLPLSKTLDYESEKDGVDWTLEVKRVTFTNVEFRILGEVSDSILFEGCGLAILSATFHLACAGVYEKSEEEVFGMNNYLFRSGDIESGAMLIPQGTNEMIGYSHYVNGEEVILRFLKTEKK